MEYTIAMVLLTLANYIAVPLWVKFIYACKEDVEMALIPITINLTLQIGLYVGCIALAETILAGQFYVLGTIVMGGLGITLITYRVRFIMNVDKLHKRLSS